MDVSAEFYKKLNQQLITKDNLIKLLKSENEQLREKVSGFEENGDRNDDFQPVIRKLEAVVEEKEREIKLLNEELASRISSENTAAGDQEIALANYQEYLSQEDGQEPRKDKL